MDHFYHHLFISFPDDWYTQSDYPLKRTKQVVREILDELGAQGLVAYHPYRSEDEHRDDDDRGFWKDFLFNQKSENWRDAKQQLERGPHFHAVVVAPHIDVSVTEKIEEETGVVIHRREDDDGRSIGSSDPDTNDDLLLAKVVSYVLSHAGIYEADDGSRRLAAWMKGPDVNDVEVYDGVASDMAELTHKAAEDTLGIASPDLECDCHEHDDQDAEPVEPGSVEMRDGMMPPEPDATGGPGDPTGPGPWSDRNADETGMIDGPADPADLHGPDRGCDHDPSTSSTSSTSKTTTTTDTDQDDDRREKCGAYLEHISQAGEYITTQDWRDGAEYADELDRKYRQYTGMCKRRNMDLDEAAPSVPEGDPDEHDPPPI